MPTAQPIIPWMGGKRRLIKQILPLFPEHHTYVEPFCGGAAVYFSKPESAVEVINDYNGELVNLYRVIKHHLEEFLRHFKWALISRQEYLLNQQSNPVTLTDIQRASRFYYLQKLAFGGKVIGQTFGTAVTSPPKLNLMRIEEDLSQAHLRLARTYIEHLDWSKCIRKYDREKTLFYLDPPYWDTAGYGIDFGFEQYQLMAELARTIQGKMVISVNDIPAMREVFQGFSMKSLDIRYTVGGSNSASPTRELLIWNWR
jgi:DNA adenine methylase